ncbi:MAG: hypothetical protein HOQ09_01260, partial [Gemmatimonadaceae bacterium]|nr:hypothetical protein [Gemmatimonadaceae bacterium]
MQTTRRSAAIDNGLTPWGFALALATLALAGWLRETRVEYLLVGWAATLVSAIFIAPGAGRERFWRGAATVLAFAACAALSFAQHAIGRARDDWPRYSAALRGAATDRMRVELDALAKQFTEGARAAVAAPGDRARAFDRLASLAGGPGERGVV